MKTLMQNLTKKTPVTLKEDHKLGVLEKKREGEYRNLSRRYYLTEWI
jgi:hypothetical protein